MTMVKQRDPEKPRPVSARERAIPFAPIAEMDLAAIPDPAQVQQKRQYERNRDHGGVYYARADGSLIREIVFPITTPNGVGLSPDGSVLYVAETETARLWAFDLTGPGEIARKPYPSPNGGRLVCGLGGYQRLDSLAVDAAGNICVATLSSGCISVISPEGTVRQIAMPDPMPTNICFGGPRLMTAYVTLSATGRVAAMNWPAGGLPLS